MEHQVYKQRRLGPGVFSIGRLVADKQTKADLKIETGAIIFDDCKNKKKIYHLRWNIRTLNEALLISYLFTISSGMCDERSNKAESSL